MELFQEIIVQALLDGELKLECSADIEKLVQNKCYQALLSIKHIVEDDSLSDEECFDKIEEIVCALEAIGSSGGTRHDFG